jgi:hypothetical protein
MGILDHLFLIGLALVVILEVVIVFGVAPRIALGASVVIVVFSALPFTPSIHVGGFHFYLEDVFCVALIGGTGVRLVMHKAVAVPGLVGLGLLVVLAIVRGVGTFGLQPAVNEARQLLYFTAAMAYFSTVPGLPRFIASFRRAWLCVGALMVGVGVFHWAQTGLGTLTSNAVSGRILTGSGAALVLEAAVVALVFPVGRGVWKYIFPTMCLAVVALSLQRTTWIAACVGLLVLLVSAIRLGERRSIALARTILVFVGIALALLLVVVPGAVDTTLGGASGSSFSQGGTFGWRIAGWQQLVPRQLSGSVENMLFGNPAGSGFARVIDNQEVTVAAHSEYVTVFVSLGIIGLLLLVAMLVSLVKGLWRRARGQDATDRRIALLFLALVSIEVVEFVSYSWGTSFGLVLGIAVAFSRGTRPGAVASSPSLRVGIVETSRSRAPGGREQDG